METTKRKFFYGWIIVAACFLIALVPMVFILNTYSYYQVPITTEFHISYVQFSISNITGAVANVLFSFFLAGRMATGNLKRYMFWGGLIAGVGVFSQSLIPSIYYLYLSQLVINFAFASMTFIPINILISRWFIDKKGLITSVVFMGSGLGGMLFSPVVAGILERYGWRMGFRVTGILTIAVAVVAGILIVNSPAEKGLEPYRENRVLAPEAAQCHPAQTTGWDGLTKAEAMRTPAFWMYAIVMLCCGITGAGIITQLPTYLVEVHVDYAAVLALHSGVAIISQLLLGVVFDKAGILVGTWGAILLHAAALVLLILTSNRGGFAYVAGALLSIGMAVNMMLPPLLTSKLFGLKGYGGIYGLGNAVFMIGNMIGPVLSTALRTSSGSYNAAWYAYIGIDLAMALFTLASVSASAKLQKQCASDKNMKENF